MNIQLCIENKIFETLDPFFFTVENESHLHCSGRGLESHFKVVVVSAKFSGKSLVSRHKTIYQLLTKELTENIHALSLYTYTPEEWKQRNNNVLQSPHCLGANKK